MFKKTIKVVVILAVAVALAAIMPWSSPAYAQEPLLGQIQMFGFNFAPRGWALCEGQLLTISENSALFALLGTTYGGDGRTTFGLPDLRGRVAIGFGQGPGLSNHPIGQESGTETNTLTVNQLPSHNHTTTANATATATATATTKGTNDEGDDNLPGGNTWAKNKNKEQYSTLAPDVVMHPDSVDVAVNVTVDSVNVTVGNTGNGQAVNNMQPYLAVNYSIALVGVFPSRN